MIAPRMVGILSAFNTSTRRWAPVFSQRQVKQTLTLTSWNVDAFSSRPVARVARILDHILQGPKSPDIVFLQEVTPDARTSLLSNPRVRADFFATDADSDPGTSAFEDVPFATMTLLSRARFASDLDMRKEGVGDAVRKLLLVGQVFRVKLPSKYGRDALCVDIVTPQSSPQGTVLLRLINVHLDSLWHTLHHRAEQMKILANVLREPGCSRGVIAGDFNAICPEDDGLVDENQLVDAWVALHGTTKPGGATWSVGVQRQDGLRSGRLDKVALMGLEATELEVLRPGSIEVPRPGGEDDEIPWSDHCGLRCTFNI